MPMPERDLASKRWQLAISVLTAWRHRHQGEEASLVPLVLAEAVADDGPVAIQAIVGLTEVANALLELYADTTAQSPAAVLEAVAAMPTDEE